ncbi:MAG TPA: MarR family transcriptional regulator [Mycobacteriales bacterium]|nr:MarR family transcriptional regulator [Mycobacteriales bacterium]
MTPGGDPLVEAARQWGARVGDPAAMATVTGLVRAQQVVVAGVEAILKPFGLSFARYEVLRLLAFSRTGALPMGSMSRRLMVHSTSVSSAVDRLERAGLVRRGPSEHDGRIVLAAITEGGRVVVDKATTALQEAAFGLDGLGDADARRLTAGLAALRRAAGDHAAGDPLHKI